jgi:hypothetical protein
MQGDTQTRQDPPQLLAVQAGHSGMMMQLLARRHTMSHTHYTRNHT